MVILESDRRSRWRRALRAVAVVFALTATGVWRAAEAGFGWPLFVLSMNATIWLAMAITLGGELKMMSISDEDRRR